LGENFQEQFNHCDLSQDAQGFEFFPKFFGFKKCSKFLHNIKVPKAQL
jgi:hypothetical protein